jgi:hypothetical protein
LQAADAQIGRSICADATTRIICARIDAPRLCSLTLTEELTTHGANRAVLAQFGVSDGPLLPDLTVC